MRGKNAPHEWNMNDFSLGWDNASPATMLDPRCVADCKNFNLTNKKGLSKRGGMAKLYATSAGTADVEQLFEYKAPSGTNYVLVATGTKIRAYYLSQWNDLKTGLTTSLNYSFSNHLGSCYITNGTDANVRLYNTTAYTVGIPVPAAAPTTAINGTGSLNGDYYHKVVYRRDTNGHSTDGNPSAISVLKQPDGTESIDVTVVASTDSNVNHIVIYRTLASGSTFYKVGETTNTNHIYNDNVADNDLTTDLEFNNDVPPKAKFTVVHKDRLFYANCPAETDGEYLVMWSKSGLSECVPALNFQYFDRADGEPITGITSIGDYLIVFKRNKISILRGDLDETSELYSIAIGVGCVASWAVLPFEDKVTFLSEEGWKACDGQRVYALSSNINGILADGWVTINQNANVTAIYYPEKSQMQYNINHSTLGQKVYCGHFLIPLLLMGKGVAETEIGALVAWTYHQYDSHELTCIGLYTDADGISRPIAGDNAGYIYVLDSGTTDETGNDITCSFKTDWVEMKTGRGLSKTCRKGYLDYTASVATNLIFNIEKDFSDTDDTQVITGTGGVGDAIGAKFDLKGTGRRFRFTITQDDNIGLDINGLSVFYRLEGRR